MRVDVPIYQKCISDKIFKLQELSEENLSGLLVVYSLTVTNAPLRLRKCNNMSLTSQGWISSLTDPVCPL